MGDGTCQNGVFNAEIGLNTDACGYDGGDCCIASCDDSLTISTGTCANRTTWRCEDPEHQIITPPPTPAPCTDLDGSAADQYDDGCAAYMSYPRWCGNYDDGDFSSEEMCCGCGGGSDTPSPTSAETPYSPSAEPTPPGSPAPTEQCFDLATEGTNDRFDNRDYPCEAYRHDPSWCAGYDDSDFTSSELCCACGGGSLISAAPTPTPCFDQAAGATDPYGDDCSDYAENPSWCGLYDGEEFSSNMMCCGCGGGGSEANCPSSCFGQTCDYYTAYTCVELETTYSCTCDGCLCGAGSPSPTVSLAPTITCINTDGTTTDEYGNGCAGYQANPDWCEYYDDFDFTSSLMCCVCGGGADATPSAAPTTLTPGPTACHDLDGDATDPYGGGCVSYTEPAWCESYDDVDFSSGTMCCACGGGSITAVPTISPAPTVQCENLDYGGVHGNYSTVTCANIESFGYTSWCSAYDTFEFTGNDLCCFCGGGSKTGQPSVSPYPTPAPTTDDCFDTTHGATDPYGDNCLAYNPHPSWCGQYEDEDFSSTTMCCVCGAGAKTCVHSERDAVDSLGSGCSFYDTFPASCGSYDSSDFTATLMCCSCGGGILTAQPSASPQPTPAPAACSDLDVVVDLSVLSAVGYDNTAWAGIEDGFCQYFDERPYNCGFDLPGRTGYEQSELCCACGGGAQEGTCAATCNDPPGSTCDSFPEMTCEYRAASGCTDCSSCDCECGNSELVGNGLCEQVALGFPTSSDLNSGECAFDDGDCCPSTCIGQDFEVPVGARIETLSSCGVYGWDCRSPEADEHPAVCEDTDNGATDTNGDSCALYTFEKERCTKTQFIDADFDASVMCCACGGGDVTAEAPNHVDTTQTFRFEAYVQKHRGPQRFYLNTTRVDLNRLYAASYGCPLSEVRTGTSLNDLEQSADLNTDGRVSAPVDTLFNPRALDVGAYAGRVALNPSFIGSIEHSYECTRFLAHTDKDAYGERASTGVLASVLDDFARIRDQDVYAKDFGEETSSADMIQVRGWPSLVDLSYAAPYNAFKFGRRIELILVPSAGPWQETYDSGAYIFFMRVLPFLVGIGVGCTSVFGLWAKRQKDGKREFKGKNKIVIHWMLGHPTHQVMLFEGIASVWVGVMHLLCGHGPGADWLPDPIRTWLLQTRASGMGLYTTLLMAMLYRENVRGMVQMMTPKDVLSHYRVPLVSASVVLIFGLDHWFPADMAFKMHFITSPGSEHLLVGWATFNAAPLVSLLLIVTNVPIVAFFFFQAVRLARGITAVASASGADEGVTKLLRHMTKWLILSGVMLLVSSINWFWKASNLFETDMENKSFFGFYYKGSLPIGGYLMFEGFLVYGRLFTAFCQIVSVAPRDVPKPDMKKILNSSYMGSSQQSSNERTSFAGSTYSVASASEDSRQSGGSIVSKGSADSKVHPGG